jgi:carbon-monoxide dehydrogenase medium subunit
VKAPPFAYARAATVAHALELLATHGDNARVLAGGQSLMPALNMRLAAPTVLIDVSRLGELAGVRVDGGAVRIGALTTHAAIECSAEVRKHLPLLADAVPHIAHPAIRNCGTFGGSLAMADPAAEWPACCVALDARFTLRRAAGSREVAAREFFTGPYSTVLQAGELLTEITLPIPAAATRHVFMELARRQGDYAIVGIAALARGREQLELTFLGAGATPLRAVKTSQAFVSKGFSDEALSAAKTTLQADLDPAADLYHTAQTKLHLAHVLTTRVMKQLFA